MSTAPWPHDNASVFQYPLHRTVRVSIPRGELGDAGTSFVLACQGGLPLEGWRLVSHDDVVLAEEVEHGVPSDAELVSKSLGRSAALAVPTDDLGAGIHAEAARRSVRLVGDGMRRIGT